MMYQRLCAVIQELHRLIFLRELIHTGRPRTSIPLSFQLWYPYHSTLTYLALAIFDTFVFQVAETSEHILLSFSQKCEILMLNWLKPCLWKRQLFPAHLSFTCQDKGSCQTGYKLSIVTHLKSLHHSHSTTKATCQCLFGKKTTLAPTWKCVT